MNSAPNSDCKQCTESKLGRVHSVHTLNPGYAHTTRALHLGRVTAPCCNAHWAVLQRAWPCRSVVSPAHPRCVVAPRSRYKNCITTQTSVARTTHRVARAAARIARRWAPYRSHVARCVVTQGRPSATIQNLYHDSPPATRPWARSLPLAPRASRLCRRVSWPYRGLPTAHPAQLCHDTIFCIVTQHIMKMGSSLFQFPT